MAKGFMIGGVDFDDIFEAPYSNFNTVTFANMSPTCKYCKGITGAVYSIDQYKNNGANYSIAPKGTLPSNNKIATVTTTGKWMKIKQEPTGFSVNGVTYTNPRGSYPIKKIGLVFCGGCAGGDGGGSEVSDDGSGFNAIWSAGNGGGGSGTVAVVLDLSMTFWLYLGAGGKGGSSNEGNAYDGGLGGNGNPSYLRYSSQSGTLLATAYGGVRGSAGEMGEATIHTTPSYITAIGTAKGGYGGTGDQMDVYKMYESEGGEAQENSALDATPGGMSEAIRGYLSQQVSGSRIDLQAYGEDLTTEWSPASGSSHLSGPGGGGRSAMGTKGGAGGDASYGSEPWYGAPDPYASDGEDGEGGKAFFYY